MNAKIRLPKTLADLMDTASKAHLAESERLLNAIKTLKIEIINADGSVAYTGAIQIDGESAKLTAQAPI